MFCALCDSFIWKEAGQVNGHRVCADCAAKLAESVKSTTQVAEDDDPAAILEEIMQTVTDCLRDAVEEVTEDAVDRVRSAFPKGKAHAAGRTRIK